MANDRFRNYFIANGKRYYTGTIFMTEIPNYPFYATKLTEATFVAYDTKRKLYIYKVAIPNHELQTNFAPEKSFYKAISYITDAVDEAMNIPETKKMSDSAINGLALGWAWYIFLMALSILFKDCIGLWIFISVVFFSWRNKKMKTKGTYYEW